MLAIGPVYKTATLTYLRTNRTRKGRKVASYSVPSRYLRLLY